MDRMRESMFSILGNLEGTRFLDLFAGSGIVALEALSRGAAGAVLVEKDGGKRRTIMQNLNIAFNSPNAVPKEAVNIVIRPVERFLHPKMERFETVHLDPPFPMKEKEKLLILADKAAQPSPGGILMIHYPSEETLSEKIGGLRRFDERNYGRSMLAFYTRDD